MVNSVTATVRQEKGDYPPSPAPGNSFSYCSSIHASLPNEHEGDIRVMKSRG